MVSSESNSDSQSLILGVVFDLDGTLLDTEKVGRATLKEYLAKYGKVLITDNENRRVGKTQKESAVAIVENYGLPLSPDQYIQEITPLHRAKWVEAKALPGANRLIKHLHKHHVPLALASNSVLEYIEGKISYHKGWRDCFSAIIGSDQVKHGKPAPDLFQEAAKKIGVSTAECLVVEDSLIGVKAAKAAQMKVVVAPSSSEADAAFLADSSLPSLLEFKPELWGLPPFNDWIDKALPVDHIHLKGLCHDGCLAQLSGESEKDDGPIDLPDQVSGVYFGWAKVGNNRVFKLVFCTGLEPTTSHRKTQICLLDENEELRSDYVMQLVLVGYIRGFSIEHNQMGSFMEISEDDRSIARAALDNSMFICPETDANIFC
ncbi:hypothetical protein V2J09_020928 [Rumex salicifolius]